MTERKDLSPLVGDVERPHPTVADSIGGELGAEPLTVRLGDLWADFMRAASQARDPEAPKGSTPTVPLLDEMKGIRQWD
ncbi:MAG TPA: hypothetical protein VK565_02210 [Gemmatimonadaceae bacterium]|jgi:hypothetical protein|nr:hypothetical protein [Gemmatimonadaceae bacterium]HMH86801.1 hypothetical protein [Gemmatimonadaceae bacterium]